MGKMENLQAKAARLLTMAHKFRQQGQSSYADMLTTKASECLDQVKVGYGPKDEKRKLAAFQIGRQNA
jgi:hypothetical protein